MIKLRIMSGIEYSSTAASARKQSLEAAKASQPLGRQRTGKVLQWYVLASFCGGPRSAPACSVGLMRENDDDDERQTGQNSERRLPKRATDWQPKARPKTASERCTGWVTLPFLAVRHRRRHLPQTVIRRTLYVLDHTRRRHDIGKDSPRPCDK
jgi:hypothetical protein